ncbi:glycoside hydrolase family 28 protein [Flavobacterium sp. LT1R49]|uniref:glycoside hydrolase family 28 protein n=1 Tax=Flavobacterium arabinosi TaxID=3398737 RepID=UPI003A89E4AB
MSTIKNIFFSLFLIIIGNSTMNSQTKKPDLKAVSIVDFGAIADGKTINTVAIQKAINAVFEKNGGRVIFPKGIFLSGSIELKSNVEMHFEDGAVLLGSKDPFQYKRLKSNKALVLANKASRISITGNGIIDGQGRVLALAVDSLHHNKIMIDSNYNYVRMRPSERNRPELINFKSCSDVTISDVTIKDASSWVQTYEQCTNLIIDKVKVNSTAFWNNDGFDIVDCSNVRITNCDVNAADDGICLKSDNPKFFNDQIYIANCKIRSSANAVKFGTASYGGFKNVIIENIKVFDTFRSAIAIESVDGGVIENVTVNNIEAVNTGNAFFIRLGYRKGKKPGIVRNIYIKNVKVQVPFGRPDINYDLRGPEVNFFHNPFPVSIAGIPGNFIQDVVLENIEISYPGRASKGMGYIPLSRVEQVPEKIKDYPEFSMFGELPAWGFYVRHVKGISFKNVKLTLDDTDYRPAFVFDDVENLSMEKITLPLDKKEQVFLNNTKSITLDNAIKNQANRN